MRSTRPRLVRPVNKGAGRGDKADSKENKRAEVRRLACARNWRASPGAMRPELEGLSRLPRGNPSGCISQPSTSRRLTHAASSAPQSIASGKSAPMAPPRIRGGHFLRQRPDSRYFSLFFQSTLRTARGRRRNPGGPVGAALGAGSRGSLESSPASFLPCSQG